AVFIAGIWLISSRIGTANILLPVESWKVRLASLGDAWQVLLLFFVVLGGIYLGFVTPTEAGALGAFVAFVMLLLSRQARPALKGKLLESCRSSITTTVMILMTMIGAGIFSYFLSLTQIPQAVAQAVTEAGVPPLAVIFLLLCIYFPLGMFLDAFSMLVI